MLLRTAVAVGNKQISKMILISPLSNTDEQHLLHVPVIAVLLTLTERRAARETTDV